MNLTNGFTFAITNSGQSIVGSFGLSQIVVYLDGVPSSNTGTYNGVFSYVGNAITSTSVFQSYFQNSPTVSYSLLGTSVSVGTYFGFLDAGNGVGLRQSILAGFDQITGSAFNDVLYGDGGNDTIDGGAGVDQMFGGTGDDTFVLDVIGDVVTENSGEGIDTILAPFTYTLGANLEKLTLTGAAAINGTGNALNNTLVGTGGDNVLDGGLGDDTLRGLTGNDTYLVDSSNDVINEDIGAGTDLVLSSVTYALSANVENLVLTGSASINGSGTSVANIITGNSGDNVLNGGNNVTAPGVFVGDTLQGGAGNDTYFIRNIPDLVVEDVGAGLDTVKTLFTYTLPANVENLEHDNVLGSAIGLFGNALDNVITSRSLLSGGNTLGGGAGNDTYVLGNAADIVQENTGEGNDTVTTAFSYILPVNIENVIITAAAGVSVTGNAQGTKFTGGSGNDTLTGGIGSDFFVGGPGNDKFVGGPGIFTDVGIDTADYSGAPVGLFASLNPSLGGDAVVFDGQGGLDFMREIENLIGSTFNDTLIGNVANNGLFGGLGNDTIDGGNGEDQLFGEGDNDSLTGGLGGDTLSGGLGNDTLSGGDDNDTLFGDGGLNVLNGDAGNDTLSGGASADTVNGGLGVDKVLYGSLAGSYTITRNGLTTNVVGPDGADTLTGVELLKFSDLSIRTIEHADRDLGDDGRSDLLWRNDNGNVLNWVMNGTAIVDNPFLASVSNDWKIADGAGDYNGDGKSDLLWRNDNGSVFAWFMNGSSIASTAFIAGVPNDWKIADGAGDYNGDGKSDVLWRNDNGGVLAWFMDGGTIASSAFIAAVPTDWKIADGSGDYNGDGKSDVLWRNDNGGVLLWQMNGSAIAGNPFVGLVGLDWKIADGAGDYDGNGKSDILWRNDDGNVLMWQMNGSAIAANPLVAPASNDWKIADGSGDYTGDGKSDVLWRNDEGTVLTWTMDGALIAGAAVISPVGADWHIQA